MDTGDSINDQIQILKKENQEMTAENNALKQKNAQLNLHTMELRRELAFHTSHIIPSKRRKLSVYYNIDDAICHQIHAVLDSLQITKSCQIPSIINKQIAGYTIGTLDICQFRNCNCDVLILNDKHFYFSDKENRWTENEYKWTTCCSNCIETAKTKLIEILQSSDLTRITRKEIRKQLELEFDVPLRTPAWKEIIKNWIYNFVAFHCTS